MAEDTVWVVLFFHHLNVKNQIDNLKEPNSYGTSEKMVLMTTVNKIG